ncbi:MAG: hypothetical protein ACAH65_06975 [Chloroflexota bacterium]
MVLAVILLILAAAGGTLLTYSFDEDAPGYARVATGIVVGLTILAFAGFITASLIGMGPAALVIALAVSLLPALGLRGELRTRVREDLAVARSDAADAFRRIVGERQVTRGDVFRVLYVGGLAFVLWSVADRTFFDLPDGLYIGNVNNLGDLPYHVQISASFAYGANFPPQNPVFSGGGFSYHYMADFLAALPVAAGASLREGLLLATLLLGGSLIALIHRWARDITASPMAARLTPLIVLCSGGFGWLKLLDEARQGERGLIGAFLGTDARYTIDNEGVFRFGNAVTTLIIPQRGLLLGLGIAVIVLTLLWQQLGAAAPPPGARGSGRSGAGRAKASLAVARRWLTSEPRMLAAGLLTGVLPIIHIHTFVVVLGTAFLFGLAFRQWHDGRWRAWALYVIAALVLALPIAAWQARGSQASLTAFIGVDVGWDHGETDIVPFWITNAGLFMPLLILAFVWDWDPPLLSRRLLLYSLPFLVWFFVPNVLRLAPWLWDNIKVLLFWWLGGAPVIALLLARLWERRWAASRIAVGALFVALIGAGALDIGRATLGPRIFREFDRDGIAFSEAVKAATPSNAVVLTAPSYNTPIFLTGRPIFMGYAGYLFANGLPYGDRERDLRAIYAGEPGAEDLLRSNAIRYIVVGPEERSTVSPNESFLSRFPVVVAVGDYRLLQVPG